MQSTFSQSSNSNEKSKHFKIKGDSLSEFFPQTIIKQQIKPIPFLYKKIAYEGNPKGIFKIAVKEYKCVSKVVASGEQTVNVLNQIKKTSCLKLVRNLSFDPYFCKTSGLKALSGVLKRFRRELQHLNLTFRRIEGQDDMIQFSLCLAKVNNLKTIKIEIPNNTNIDFEAFKNLTEGYQKLYSVRAVEVGIGASKDITQNLYKLGNMPGNYPKIEKTNFYLFFPHATPTPGEEIQIKGKRSRKAKFASHIKSLSWKLAFKTGWASYFDGGSIVQGFNAFLRMVPSFANPIHLSLTFDKMHMPLETLKAFADVVPKLSNLRHVFLELNQMKLADFEFMILAKGFVDCKQIQHLTFKYFDNAIIPMADLLRFIVIMAKHSVFPQFDLLFRKLFNPEWQTPEVKRELDGLETVQYTLTKQSIHIQKIN